MDDWKQAQLTDKAIENIKKIAFEREDYQEIFEEKVPGAKKLFSYVPAAGRERVLFKLGLILVKSAKSDDCRTLESFIDNKFPLNFQHPITGRTALHTAMAFGSAKYGKKLVETEQCDYLLEENNTGYLAADFAYSHLTDLDIFDVVLEKTTNQAKDKGLDPNKIFKHQEDGYLDKKSDEVMLGMIERFERN